MEIESLQSGCWTIVSYQETKKVSWKWRLKVQQDRFWSYNTSLKQRKSPENGDWKSFFKASIFSTVSMKQRKSPENGDWKFTTSGRPLSFTIRNKESLLKMEIESLFCLQFLYPQRMRNKESLLKMEIESLLPDLYRHLSFSETKKVSWKWRLKANSWRTFNSRWYVKQRKSPENGDWKKGVAETRITPFLRKQRKSPENGDWKFILIFAEILAISETKKVSWKWRLKGL